MDDNHLQSEKPLCSSILGDSSSSLSSSSLSTSQNNLLHSTSACNSSSSSAPSSPMSSGIVIDVNSYVPKATVKSAVQDSLKGFHNKLHTKLKDGKAALEFKELKQKSLQRFKEFKEIVKDEVKQIELGNIKARQQQQQPDDLDSCGRKTKVSGSGWVLTREQMEFLRRNPYLYCASAGSYLELFCLQKFWTWLAKFIPTAVAPSTLTFLGLAINVLCCLNLLYFSPDFRAEAPFWAFLLCALGTFLYQTLDALDGKQAGKVQNSPIEELTDHGCDAVSTVFVTISVAIATQMGNHPFLLYLFFLFTMVVFFSTHLVAHSTHTMVFGKIDVSEGQWAMILTHLVAACFGGKIWRTHLFTVLGMDISLIHVATISSIISLVHCIFNNIRMTVLGYPTPLEAYGIRIPRRSRFSVYNPLVPLSILILLATMNYNSGLLMLSPSVFIFTYGFAFAKLVIHLVMVNVSRGYLDKWDSSLFAPIWLTLNCSFLHLVHPYTALLCALVYSLMDFARYFTYSLWDLRVALDAYIFSLKYPVGHAKNRGGSDGFYINGFNNDKVLKEWQEFEVAEKDKLMKELFGSY